MKVGDLVRYKSLNKLVQTEAWKEAGVILRCISGTDRVKVVQWTTGTKCSYPERNLELVNESR